MPKQTMEEGAVFPSPPQPDTPNTCPPGETVLTRDDVTSLEAAVRIVIEALDEFVQGGPITYMTGATRFRSRRTMARVLLSPAIDVKE